MKDAICYVLFLLWALAFAHSARAQKGDVAFNNVETTKEIRSQITTLTQRQGELAMFCQEHAIHGEFVVDLTVERKGKVLTVFMVSGGEDDVPRKNLLKNKLKNLRFDQVEIPKKERVKLRYTFNL